MASRRSIPNIIQMVRKKGEDRKDDRIYHLPLSAVQLLSPPNPFPTTCAGGAVHPAWQRIEPPDVLAERKKEVKTSRGVSFLIPLSFLQLLPTSTLFSYKPPSHLLPVIFMLSCTLIICCCYGNRL